MHGQAEGAQFEALVEKVAMRLLIAFEKIINVYHGPTGTYYVKAPYDCVLAYQGKVAMLDLKTYDDQNLKCSNIVPHQLKALLKMDYQNITAGYLVWYRTINLVVLYNPLQLQSLTEGQSLKPTDGMPIGPIENMNLRLIFDRRKKRRAPVALQA